jgi:hypothetical protein
MYVVIPKSLKAIRDIYEFFVTSWHDSKHRRHLGLIIKLYKGYCIIMGM